MRLEKYISDLLYRYECVIVPGFGGFVTNKISSKLDKVSKTFYPPFKQITFNRNLKNNDGLLANYISSCNETSFDESMNFITNEVDKWNAIIEFNQLDIKEIGTISKNKENQFNFQPNKNVNFLMESFGLSFLPTKEIIRTPIIDLVTKQPDSPKVETVSASTKQIEKKRKLPVFIRYAAAIAIVGLIGTAGWNMYEENKFNEQLILAQEQQFQVDSKIQQATFSIADMLPGVKLNVTKEKFRYHIIGGAFREQINAEQYVMGLQIKGYNATVLGANKWDLIQVAIDSYKTKFEAQTALGKMRKKFGKDVWILVKEY